MQKKLIAIGVLALTLAGCRSLDKKRDAQLSRVAKDWCLTIRASQVLPVYPLTEDLQVGDVFLVSTPLSDEVHDLETDGFLPLDNVIARIQPTGWQTFYNGSYGIGDTSIVPRQWQFPTPPPTAPPLTAWSIAPGAAFPTYTFQVKQGAGATLAIPIQAVPVGLSLLQTGDASGTVNIASASTYGLPITMLSPQIDAWAAENQNFLKQYAPHMSTGKNGKPAVDQHYVRVVYRVYVAGGVNVSLMANQSRGGRLDAGASEPIALFDAGNSTEGANTAADYASILSSLSKSVAAATPAGNITIASASSRGVAMNETFPRPLVIGYLAFDRAIEADGRLGAPLPTEARVSGEHISATTTVFATDSNADRLRTWLSANPSNRETLTQWLSRNAANTSIAIFLNSSQFETLRAKAVQELGVR
ncbi:MAG TPA: hypothetical protein VGQ36_27505 [Thermoanaerobaculia bacterium]|jgi:hypothetical protein|nr:hypothetical protein [Thermoanaerobaculia bacterium]